MPFPLAHPAAVLPLRRYCPKPLSFVALVIGSISPDVGYLFGGSYLEELSHSFVAGTAFGLVVGSVLLGLFYGLGPLALRVLNQRTRQMLGPLIQWPANSVLELALSLVLGVWTHLLLDSVTHAHGWVVLHWPALRTSLFLVGGRHIRVCHLLWYGVSFVGVGLLALTFLRSQLRASPGESPNRGFEWIAAFLIATMIVPIEIFHHLVRSKVGLVLVIAMTLVFVLALLLGLGFKGRSSLQSSKFGRLGSPSG